MTGLHNVLFDTSVATENIGDEIIIDAVRTELQTNLGNEFWIRLPTHDYIGRVGRQWIQNARFCLVGGTNLLSSNYRKYRQWKISPLDAVSLAGKVILMGVGWWQYQDPPDALTALLYRSILCRNEGVFHSVRDDYTRDMLNSIGVTNVLNTSCPTMWCLGPEECKKIPLQRGESVLLTLTDYNKKPDWDRLLIQQLGLRYRNVMAWPQGIGDRTYLRELGVANIIEPGLRSLDAALSFPMVDYVGTRLHAGVRALQHGRRTIIIAVDNRAIEISRDTGLWVIGRDEVEELIAHLDAKKEVYIKLPVRSIEKWRKSMAEALARGSNEPPVA